MTDLAAFEANLTRAEREIEREIGQAKALAQRVKDDTAQADDLEDLADALEEAAGVMNSFADLRQREIIQKIEALVTHGLQSIFGYDLRFAVLQETKARRVETRFVVRSLISGEEIETGIMDARGGGVAAVAGFLLRLIICLLSPGRTPFLFLDESFAQLSTDYEPALAEFIRELVDKTSVQILLVTHSPQYEDVADTTYRFSMGDDGRTRAEVVT